MPIFGLCSTSDDQPSNLSNESWPKCIKRPPKSSKNQMLIFGLCSTSDNLLSDLSNESWPKCKKGPLSHQKMKCSFLDYVQLLMIGQVIWVMKVNQNVKKAPWFIKKLILIFGLHSTSDDRLSNLSDKSQPKCKKGPLSHQKIKCSFLDYVQLLMICRVIWVTKVNCNANKGPLSHQK